MGFYECRDCSRPPDECRCGERELRDRLESAEQQIADLREVVRVMARFLIQRPNGDIEMLMQVKDDPHAPGQIATNATWSTPEEIQAINKVMGGE